MSRFELWASERRNAGRRKGERRRRRRRSADARSRDGKREEAQQFSLGEKREGERERETTSACPKSSGRGVVVVSAELCERERIERKRERNKALETEENIQPSSSCLSPQHQDTDPCLRKQKSGIRRRRRVLECRCGQRERRSRICISDRALAEGRKTSSSPCLTRTASRSSSPLRPSQPSAPQPQPLPGSRPAEPFGMRGCHITRGSRRRRRQQRQQPRHNRQRGEFSLSRCSPPVKRVEGSFLITPPRDWVVEMLMCCWRRLLADAKTALGVAHSGEREGGEFFMPLPFCFWTSSLTTLISFARLVSNHTDRRRNASSADAGFRCQHIGILSVNPKLLPQPQPHSVVGLWESGVSWSLLLLLKKKK